VATDATRVGAHSHSAEDLDDLFGALSHRYRRSIIEHLEWGEPRSLDELVAGVVEQFVDATARTGRSSLVHNHLPRLAAAGVIAYDEAAGIAELDDAVAERTVLAAIGDAD
jgi:hypothetical protein